VKLICQNHAWIMHKDRYLNSQIFMVEIRPTCRHSQALRMVLQASLQKSIMSPSTATFEGELCGTASNAALESATFMAGTLAALAELGKGS